MNHLVVKWPILIVIKFCTPPFLTKYHAKTILSELLEICLCESY